MPKLRHPRYICMNCEKVKDVSEFQFFKGKTCFGVCRICLDFLTGSELYDLVNNFERIKEMCRKFPAYSEPYLERYRAMNKCKVC